ncbi:hypothetical protein EIP86_000045 [Pleurotus ostreatoroseus]|nr:hypothetical protein EIP86_000045 [Pleurotus ostreatoroseus]
METWPLQPDYAEALDREGSMEGPLVAPHGDAHSMLVHAHGEIFNIACGVVTSPASMPVLGFEYPPIESSNLIPIQSILGYKPVPSLDRSHEIISDRSTSIRTQSDERLVVREFMLCGAFAHSTSKLQDIPQTPYAARTQRPIERRSVLFNCEGQDVPGIPLETVLRGNLRILKNAENRTILDGFGEKVSYRIGWKGYPSFSAQQNCTRIKKGQISYVPLAEIVRQVARVTQKFLEHNSRVQPTDEQWRVGPGHISAEDVVLLGIEIVSKGSVQPIYQVFQKRLLLSNSR